ncbi:MAG: four helix bundle protein [Bacteroidota bacterium]|nr:four helix bundle protein [Bacteroidota bacterium]
MSEYKPFTDLEVWKKSRAFKKEIEALPKNFPPEEKYKLTDQIVRSVRSVNANIAEGHGRFGYPDQIKFCMNARGSLNETLNHLIDAYDCKYISSEELVNYQTKYNEVMKLLNGYINYLRNMQRSKVKPA